MSTLTFLLDTNAVITLEPYAGAAERDHALLAEFLRTARENGHHVATHAANEADLRETGDDVHRAANLRALQKYELLPEPPIPTELASAVGEPEIGTNDHRDLRLLAAVSAGAATHLLTSDERFIRRAMRAGLGEQVLRPAEALDLLRRLHPQDPPAPPQVRLISAALLDLSQPIFDSLRADYDFDAWIRSKVAPDPARRTWIVEGDDGQYRAIAIVKPNDEHPNRSGRWLKLCTFKVDEGAGGEKLGELLLKTVLAWAHSMSVPKMFVTVIKDGEKALLVHFLNQFGFREASQLEGSTNEYVFEKHLLPDGGVSLPPLEHHVTYGPPAVSASSPVFVIPIQPTWYAGLFPDSPSHTGAETLPGMSSVEIGPFGNAIRKAYLSNSRIKDLPSGATVLFYRSAASRRRGSARGTGSVYAVGVVERTLRSHDPVEVLTMVGRRTVYPADEVARMCQGGVIAVLFRQDRFLPEPWPLEELLAAGVLNGWPQTITRAASKEGEAWVLRQLSE